MFVATPTPQAPPSRSRLGAIGAQRPQVFHLFLHDLRRVAIVLVLFWLSFGSMLSLFWAGRNTGYPNPLSFRELALPLVVGLLFVGRSPGSRQAMWLTRPVDWRSWLVAKLAIVGLVFVPRVAVQVSSYQRADLEAPIFWLATSGMVSFEVLKVVFFVALATLGREIGRAHV